jgi:hypothetical protein
MDKMGGVDEKRVKLFVGIEDRQEYHSIKEFLNLQARGGREPVEYPIRQERFLFIVMIYIQIS